MGCGCKGDKISPANIKENGELNLRGKLLKLPIALAITLLIVVISPLLLVVIWYMAVSSVFGKHQNVIDLLLLKKFRKNSEEIPYMEEDEDDFNEEDYEIVGVDIIK